MLSHLESRGSALLPPNNSWGMPLAQELLQIISKSLWATDLYKIAAHCLPKPPTRQHRAPKWCSKAYFWELPGTLLLENLR